MKSSEQLNRRRTAGPVSRRAFSNTAMTTRRLSRPLITALIAGGLWAGGAALSTLTAAPAAAEPTGCVAGSVGIAAASYCSGGTGEHRVDAPCLTSTMVGTALSAHGPWRAPGELSVVTIGAPTQAGACILAVLGLAETR